MNFIKGLIGQRESPAGQQEQQEQQEQQKSSADRALAAMETIQGGIKAKSIADPPPPTVDVGPKKLSKKEQQLISSKQAELSAQIEANAATSAAIGAAREGLEELGPPPQVREGEGHEALIEYAQGLQKRVLQPMQDLRHLKTIDYINVNNKPRKYYFNNWIMERSDGSKVKVNTCPCNTRWENLTDIQRRLLGNPRKGAKYVWNGPEWNKFSSNKKYNKCCAKHTSLTIGPREWEDQYGKQL